ALDPERRGAIDLGENSRDHRRHRLRNNELAQRRLTRKISKRDGEQHEIGLGRTSAARMPGLAQHVPPDFVGYRLLLRRDGLGLSRERAQEAAQQAGSREAGTFRPTRVPSLAHGALSAEGGKRRNFGSPKTRWMRGSKPANDVRRCNQPERR